VNIRGCCFSSIAVALRGENHYARRKNLNLKGTVMIKAFCLFFFGIMFFFKESYDFDSKNNTIFSVHPNSHVFANYGVNCNQNSYLPPRLTGDLEKYYKYINLASRAIYINNYLSATAYYDSAFLYKKYPNYVDLKNYVLVNYKCKLFNKNDASIRLLITEKGIDTSLLFLELPRRVFSASNLKLIRRLEDESRIDKQYNNKLSEKIKDIFIVDQEAHDYSEYNLQDHNIADKAYRRKDSIDNDNAMKFLCICKEEGFPTEETVGIFFKKGQEWSFVTYVLIWHFLQSDYRDEVIKMMDEELIKGNLHPSLYASHLDFVNDNLKVRKKEYNFMNTTVCLMQNEAYKPFVYYTDSLMNEVNTNRISIGLDSFNITQKQVVCKKFDEGADKNGPFITMSQYPKIERFPYAIVKAAFEKENQDLSTYKINTSNILKECTCKEKHY